ncbi:uncharacterized protein [Penaeus vannamei]|uniref:uncharacterized protein n=1 Tax=Penaeus vannamei TaxID=6689 RepID=UPI00387F6ABE
MVPRSDDGAGRRAERRRRRSRPSGADDDGENAGGRGSSRWFLGGAEQTTNGDERRGDAERRRRRSRLSWFLGGQHSGNLTSADEQAENRAQFGIKMKLALFTAVILAVFIHSVFGDTRYPLPVLVRKRRQHSVSGGVSAGSSGTVVDVSYGFSPNDRWTFSGGASHTIGGGTNYNVGATIRFRRDAKMDDQ